MASMQDRWLDTVIRMEAALTEMRAALERDDYKDCIDWGLTLRSLQTELEMPIITRLTNR